MTGADVVRVARGFIGVRYRHQGRSRDGVDCVGLPICVRAELGLRVMDFNGYGRVAMDSQMLDLCKEHLIEVPRADMQPGDMLVQTDGIVRHMAIVADCPYGENLLSIVHAWMPNRRVVECRLDDYFMQTVRGCFRFPEVTA